MGTATQSGSAGVAATLVSNGITWTAQTFGTAGNSITVAVVAGGTAGAEVVTVTGTAISVQVESTVSTRTQVLTAVQASAAATALVSISVASGGTAASLLSATALASGTDTVFTIVGCQGMTITQINTGLYRATLADKYQSLLNANIMSLSSTAADLQPQIKSMDVTTAKTIDFRIMAGATPTNLATGQGLLIRFDLRNSSQTP